MSLPAPELFDGVSFAMYHNTKGHAAYFMGEIRNTGWWYFFPVLLWLKRPSPGSPLWDWLRCGGAARPAGLLDAAGVRGGNPDPSMTSHVNIGLRHILPIFTGSRSSPASACWAFWNARPRAKWAGPLAAMLVLWAPVSGIVAAPRLPLVLQRAGRLHAGAHRGGQRSRLGAEYCPPAASAEGTRRRSSFIPRPESAPPTSDDVAGAPKCRIWMRSVRWRAGPRSAPPCGCFVTARFLTGSVGHHGGPTTTRSKK